MNILKTRKIWLTVSLILSVISVVAMFSYHYRLGIDFAGGTNLELRLGVAKSAVAVSVDTAISTAYASTAHFEVAPQSLGDDRYLIRSMQINNEQKNAILAQLGTQFESAEELRFESVDPTISADVVRKAILAVIVAIFGILLYLAYAFRRIPRPFTAWHFGTATIIASAHDLLLLLGAYAILSHFAGAEVDGLFIAALLTVLGFSTHDTIVTFDRIRENLRRRSGDDVVEIFNDSVTETVVRSINTSFTVFLVLLAMFLFGGATLKFFTLALLIGVVFGTYSSIFIATPILLWLGRKQV